MCLYDPLVVYQQLTLGSSSPDLEIWEMRHNVMLEIFPSGDSALRIHQHWRPVPSGALLLGQALGESESASGIEIQ
jgi:hypothetical protein